MKNLENMRFGRLTVIERVSGNKWRCQCDCGKEKITTKYNLLNGITKSYGCLHKKSVSIDITGQCFGHLLAIESKGESKNGSVIWRFRCDCGNEIDATFVSVKWGRRKSCGCANLEAKRKNALNAQKHLERIDGTAVYILLSKKLGKNNTSGYKGVIWSKFNQKWIARIIFKGVNYHLGYFEKTEDAVKARTEAEDRLYGPFLEWYEEYKRTYNINNSLINIFKENS